MTYRCPILCVLVLSSVGLAQTQPATTQQSLKATITGVEGLVQVRETEDREWAKAQVGMTVGELAEFRTGPKSAVRFTIPPDQTITLDRLGTVKLLTAINDGGKLKTNLGMKYGRTRFDIEAAGREHDATISSPSSTLAVRGTKVSLYDQRPFRAEAVSLTGRAEFRTGKKQLAFGARNQGKTKVNTEQPSAASLALTQSVVDPSLSLARSSSEGPLIQNLISSGATVFFDREAGIKVISGGDVPNDMKLIPTLPGMLNFVARWYTNSDLNFSVATPGGAGNVGEVLYPAGVLARNSSGGRVAFDHRGGKNGGIEIIYYPGSSFPDGLYGLGLFLISGPPTTATIDVFLNGKRIDIFDGQGLVKSSTVQVAKPIPGFVDATAAGIVPINIDLPIGGAPTPLQKVALVRKRR